MIPYVIKREPTDFEEMVQTLLDREKGVNLVGGRLPDSTYWLVTEDNKVVG